jgi:hypothetical protein
MREPVFDFEKSLEKIENPAMREWFRQAHRHGRLNESWFEVHRRSEQHKAWIMHFRDHGLPLPVTLDEINEGFGRSWTAPAEWPADFPYRAGPRLEIVR